MEPLGKDELACLHNVGQGRVYTAADCRPGVLLALQRLGLVLRRPQRLLPLESMAQDYILSRAGRRLVERNMGGGK